MKLAGAASRRYASAADRPAISGIMILLAVLALHLFGLGVALSPPLRAPTETIKPLVFLTELPPAVNSPSTGASATVSVRRPRRPMPTSTDTDGVIVDAVPADAAQVARICGGWPAQRRRHDDAQPEPSVLIRVDEDGRVSDSRFLVGSGSVDSDAALQHCLLTLARLTPLRLEGRAVAAWQRLRPTEAASARRR